LGAPTQVGAFSLLYLISMNENEGKVGELNDELNSRTKYHPPEDVRTPVQPVEQPAEVAPAFQSPKIEELLQHEMKKNTEHPLVKKIFISTLIFCVLAGGVAAFIFFGGGNFISSKNVDITVNGPVSVSAGEPVELGVILINKNNTDLELVTMSVDFPEGTRSAEDVNTALTRTKIAIGSIGQGKNVTKTLNAVLFGQTGDIKQIKINVDYRVKGSNATFNKTKVYEVSIGTTPIGITVGQPSTVTSGETFTTTLTILANSNNTLKNVVVRGEYPYGYNPVSTTPTSVGNEKNSWSLGDLAPGDKRTITIRGVLVGENQDERTFRFYAGIGSADDATKFDTALSQVSETVLLDRPNVALKINLNGEADSSVAPAGKSIQGSVSLQNNLPSTLTNAKVVVKLSGTSLDRFSVIAQTGGFYNSSDNSITWTKDNNQSLALLAPGQSQTLGFSFASISNLPVNTKNPEIKIQASFVGTTQGGRTNDVAVSEDSTVKISSQVTLDSKAFYSKGPFLNKGPMPPKADKITTYTVTFSLGNTQNDIDAPVVTATLGPNVKWLSAATSTENISYNINDNTVTWSLGKLDSGAGFSGPLRTASFQISLTPSIGQIGSIPTLVNNIMFSGMDTFTNKAVNLTSQNITTRISSDPKFIQGNDVVVK
jgi:hypothetical protein